MSFTAKATKVIPEATYELKLSNTQAEKLFAILAYVNDEDLDDVFEALSIPVRGDWAFNGSIDGELELT